MGLTALSEDRSVRSTDRAKLHGYCKQWVDSKYLLGCALFLDLLTPCAAFSRAMQAEEIDILGALMSLLRSLKEIEKLAGLPLSHWPTYASTLANFKPDAAIDCWWNDKQRRPNQKKRNPSIPSSSATVLAAKTVDSAVFFLGP